MKLIIAGSRDIVLTVDELELHIKKHLEMVSEFSGVSGVSQIKEVVSGCAKGVDTTGILWANKYGIPIKKFIPDWTIGRSAGHIRNRDMGDYADQAIVIYNGSKGSQGMIDYMKKLKKPCTVIKV